VSLSAADHASLHLTLNPIVDPGDGPDEAVVHSILLIIDPAPPITIRTAAAITQTVRRQGGTWRSSRRSVAAVLSRSQRNRLPRSGDRLRRLSRERGATRAFDIKDLFYRTHAGSS
jgi:hypothetical protein